MDDEPRDDVADLSEVVGVDLVPLSDGSVPVLPASEPGEPPRVILRHVAQALGIDYTGAWRLIRSRSGGRVVGTTTRDRQGRRVRMVTTDPDSLVMFLATLNEHRISDPVVRRRVVAWQCEARDALGAYARRGIAVNPRGLTDGQVEHLERSHEAMLAGSPAVVDVLRAVDELDRLTHGMKTLRGSTLGWYDPDHPGYVDPASVVGAGGPLVKAALRAVRAAHALRRAAHQVPGLLPPSGPPENG